jgi:hypothetical protein
MKYSRFNEATGMYDVYEDSARHALNDDLPVPRFGQDVNGIGIPARHAARPLPSSARRVGESWAPVGVVAGGAAGALGAVEWAALSTPTWIVGGAAVFGLLGALRGNAIGGAAAGALLGALGAGVAKGNR